METTTNAIATLTNGADTLFLLLGAIMVLAMHAGFAFLELGTVRHKNQVNALVKIITDFGISTLAYFFIGYYLAYDKTFLSSASTLMSQNGLELTRFFFLLTFAAAIPAIVSGGAPASTRCCAVHSWLSVWFIRCLKELPGMAASVCRNG